MTDSSTAKRPARSSQRSTGTAKASGGFTAEEKAAMRERARELKVAGRRGAASTADGESDVMAKIAEMQSSDRRMATRIHAIVKENAPDLSCRTWYGMPAYAKEGSVICFFKSAQKFKSRYATLGFSDKAKLDDGAMWPTDYALLELTPEVESRIAALIKQAVG
jgi:uncharacterized protein YdhG (YjbR/CyaY superfamily)